MGIFARLTVYLRVQGREGYLVSRVPSSLIVFIRGMIFTFVITSRFPLSVSFKYIPISHCTYGTRFQSDRGDCGVLVDLALAQ